MMEEFLFLKKKKKKKKNYAEKILKKFGMFGCKSGTALVSNEKMMKEDGVKKVDETLYRSLVGNLSYLYNKKAGHHVCFQPAIEIHVQSKSVSFWCWKKCLEVYSKYKELWN